MLRGWRQTSAKPSPWTTQKFHPMPKDSTRNVPSYKTHLLHIMMFFRVVNKTSVFLFMMSFSPTQRISWTTFLASAEFFFVVEVNTSAHSLLFLPFFHTLLFHHMSALPCKLFFGTFKFNSRLIIENNHTDRQDVFPNLTKYYATMQ